MSKKTEVNEPLHYNGERFECIDVMEDNMTREAFQGFLSGNVFKYIWRYKEKGGLMDVAKASWYVNRLYKSLEDDEIRKTAMGCGLVGDEEEVVEKKDKYIVEVWADPRHSADGKVIVCYIYEETISSLLEEATRFNSQRAADTAAEKFSRRYNVRVVQLDEDGNIPKEDVLDEKKRALAEGIY